MIEWEEVYKSPVGNIYLYACDKGLTGALWERKKLHHKEEKTIKASQYLKSTEKELDLYFQGKLTKFKIPLCIEGTVFQKEVWKALTKIPFGKTLSYCELATNVKKPKASRAVGSANGKNPFSIIIPCHRVIRKSGELGGYAGGLKAKEKLLKLESSNRNS